MANPIEFKGIHGKGKVVAGDSRVRLRFDGAVTREAIRKLWQYLELAEDDLSLKGRVGATRYRRPPEQPAIYRDA
jgi:hypothetical protein